MAEKDKQGSGKGLFMQIHLGAISIAGDRVPSYVGEGGTLSRESSCPAFSRSEEGRESFLCLLFLNSLRPKTALMPRWHVSGGHGTTIGLAKGRGGQFV